MPMCNKRIFYKVPVPNIKVIMAKEKADSASIYIKPYRLAEPVAKDIINEIKTLIAHKEIFDKVSAA